MVENPELTVKLEVFEGPLDLLCHLIKKNEVDIYDIPIAIITDQYLKYLGLMKVLNLDIAGEYLVMSATLLHIKSKMLLPSSEPGDESEEEEEGEDPRAELVQRLLEYQAFKDAARSLEGKEILERDVFVRGRQDGEGEDGEGLLEIGLFELIEAFQHAIDQWREDPSIELTVDRLTLTDRIHWIADHLKGRKRGLSLQDLFLECHEKRELIVTFLALLEMIRQRMIRAYQTAPYGTISVISI